MTSPIAGHPDKTANPVRKKRWWIAVLAVGIVGLLLAAPTLLGTKQIYEPIIDRFAQDKLDLKIDSVRLRWFSPLLLEGITVREHVENGQSTAPLLQIESIQCSRGLFGFLLNGRNLGRVEVNRPVLDITLLEDGTNIEKMIKAVENSNEKDSSKPKSNPLVDLDIAIRGLSVRVDTNDSENPMQVIPPMNADISYRAVNSEPTVIVHPTQILDHVNLTPELVRLGLGHAIPLLAKSAWFDGSISLATEELRVPLQRPTQTTGSAVLTLHQVRTGPSEPLIVGALDALAQIRKKDPSHEIVFVDGSKVLVKMENERVFHSGLEAGFPKLDPRLQLATEGFVGVVDRSLDLKLELPVPVEQIARRETVQKLGVPRVTLPIGGTLDAPEVQWNVMRGESAALLALISNRLQSEAPITSTIVDALSGITDGQADQTIEAAVDFVKQLRERRTANRTNPEEAEKDTPNDEPRRPLRDAFRKALRGK